MCFQCLGKASAFPDTGSPIGMDNVVRAIATFARSLISANSPYDRYVRHGEHEAMARRSSLYRHEQFGIGVVTSLIGLKAASAQTLIAGTKRHDRARRWC